MTMTYYRKKPVVIQAIRWFKNGDHPQVEVGRYSKPDVPDDCVCNQCGQPYLVHGLVNTLEDMVRVCPGDWIITGNLGEIYPCKPDVFDAVYEQV